MTKTPKTGPDPGHRPEGNTRVDLAHASQVVDEAGDQVPSIELLEAIAGQDSQASTQQLRGQALELAGILREKQRLLEQRESELNARTALLENELRQARMKQYRDLPAIDEPTRTPGNSPTLSPTGGFTEPPSAKPSLETNTSHAGKPLASATSSVAAAAAAPPQACAATPAAEESNRHFDWSPWDAAATDQVAADSTEFADHQVIIETDLAKAARQAEADYWRQHGMSPDRPRGTESASDTDRANTSQRAVNAELQTEYEHLEQQRRLHRQREFRLERREKTVEQLYEEVTLLHREALELRLTTEQIWADLTEDHPHEQLTQSLTELRSRLTDHYRMANDCLARRKDELHQLRAEVTLQEQRVRQQRRDIQLWADRRYDEIEARAAQLLVRERELDQTESDFQRQTLEWQKQRDAFRQQIESLKGRLAS